MKNFFQTAIALYYNEKGTMDLPLDEGTTPVDITFVHLRKMDLPSALLATIRGRAEELLGYAAFETRASDSPLINVEPRFMDLQMLKVDPEYFQKGIGKALLHYSKVLARRLHKVLILRAEQPGFALDPDLRSREYPLTTEQLRNMYARNGFRHFTPEEQEFLVRRLDEAKRMSSSEHRYLARSYQIEETASLPWLAHS